MTTTITFIECFLHARHFTSIISLNFNHRNMKWVWWYTPDFHIRKLNFRGTIRRAHSYSRWSLDLVWIRSLCHRLPCEKKLYFIWTLSTAEPDTVGTLGKYFKIRVGRIMSLSNCVHVRGGNWWENLILSQARDGNWIFRDNSWNQENY